MPKRIKGFIILLAIMMAPQIIVLNTQATGPWTVLSPDGSIAMTITQQADGSVVYSVKKNNYLVIDNSKLGIKTDAADFYAALSYVSTSTNTINEHYSLPSCKKSTYINNANERTITFSKNNRNIDFVFRAYNDGIAYRYYIYGSGAATINSEYSEFNMPASCGGGWAQTKIYQYEATYPYNSAAQLSTGDFGMPLLCSINNNQYWVLLTEAAVYNMDGNYCACHLHGTSGTVMKVVFAPEQTSPVSAMYPFASPWRAAVIAPDLNTLVNSTLVYNLNPPSILQDTSWIKPGRIAWSWWSDELAAELLSEQKKYVDFAASMGWESVTVDAGWDDSWLSDLCSYAEDKGVSIWLWSDRQTIDTQAEIDEKLPLWASWGVKGIKVDFFMDDSQTVMNMYDLIAEGAAANHLMVNFHGSTKPSGEGRTWPHVVTSEGILGLEHYKWSNLPDAQHNCTVPFTRNVVGPMDYTPVGFSNSNRNTTHAHQLALSVVFESGAPHFAGSIYSFETWPGREFLRVVPAVWDETKVVAGFPGDYVVMARRKGNDWFVGAITYPSRTVDIPLSFLNPGVAYTANVFKDGGSDNFITNEQLQVTSTSVLRIPLRASGGCAIHINRTSYEAEAVENSLGGGAYVYSWPPCSGGEKVIGLGMGGYVQYNTVYLSRSGDHKITIHYLAGEQRSFYVSVNDGAGREVVCPSTGGWDVVGTKEITVSLSKGTNTIKFYNDTYWAPDLDRVVINTWDAPPVAPAGTEYEAEAGGNTLYGEAGIYDCGNCSGGKMVGYLGMTGAVQFNNVYAGSGGNYTMRMYYLTADPRSFYINVNGADIGKFDCAISGGWDVVRAMDVTVSLNQGNNTIKFYNNSAYAPSLDKIRITAGAPPVGNSFEAEAAALGGGAYVYNCSSCSGGQKVIGMGMGGYAIFDNVYASDAGYYLMSIHYLAGENRPFYVSVNEGVGDKVICFNSGGWEVVAPKEVKIYLNQGYNTIKIYSTDEYAPDLDRIVIKTMY